MGLFDRPSRVPINVDDSGISALFVDLTRLTETAEVVIIDFGLLPHSSASDQGKIVRRVAMNFYTAKRFLEALRLTVKKHEETFGTIEAPTVWEGETVADAEQACPTYANFVRVTGTPEELLLDFALNPQPVGPPPELRVSHRVIMTFSTAKKLRERIAQVIRQHEARLGERIRPRLHVEASYAEALVVGIVLADQLDARREVTVPDDHGVILVDVEPVGQLRPVLQVLAEQDAPRAGLRRRRVQRALGQRAGQRLLGTESCQLPFCPGEFPIRDLLPNRRGLDEEGFDFGHGDEHLVGNASGRPAQVVPQEILLLPNPRGVLAVRVDDQDAWNTKLALATREGLLLGISAGANVWAAIEVAKALGPGKNVVTILCDTGERYFSLGDYFA